MVGCPRSNAASISQTQRASCRASRLTIRSRVGSARAASRRSWEVRRSSSNRVRATSSAQLVPQQARRGRVWAAAVAEAAISAPLRQRDYIDKHQSILSSGDCQGRTGGRTEWCGTGQTGLRSLSARGADRPDEHGLWREVLAVLVPVRQNEPPRWGDHEFAGQLPRVVDESPLGGPAGGHQFLAGLPITRFPREVVQDLRRRPLQQTVEGVGSAVWITQQGERIAAALGDGGGALRFALTDGHDLRAFLFVRRDFFA